MSTHYSVKVCHFKTVKQGKNPVEPAIPVRRVGKLSPIDHIVSAPRGADEHGVPPVFVCCRVNEEHHKRVIGGVRKGEHEQEEDKSAFQGKTKAFYWTNALMKAQLFWAKEFSYTLFI